MLSSKDAMSINLQRTCFDYWVCVTITTLDDNDNTSHLNELFQHTILFSKIHFGTTVTIYNKLNDYNYRCDLTATENHCF